MIDTLTVGQLKLLLEEFPDHAKVTFSYPSGDFWRTQIVAPVLGARFVRCEPCHYHKGHRIQEPGSELPGEEVLVLG